MSQNVHMNESCLTDVHMSESCLTDLIFLLAAASPAHLRMNESCITEVHVNTSCLAYASVMSPHIYIDGAEIHVTHTSESCTCHIYSI